RLRMRNGDAQFPFAREVLLLLIREEAVRHASGVFAGQHILVGEENITINAEGWRDICNQVQVRSPQIDCSRDQGIQLRAVHFPKNFRQRSPMRRNTLVFSASVKSLSARWLSGSSSRACS